MHRFDIYYWLLLDSANSHLSIAGNFPEVILPNLYILATPHG